MIVAILIAVPAAWIIAGQWLQNFAYRIEVDWWMLALTGFVAIFIAVITVSAQALRAAAANQVNSLKTE